jgi:hypothetical protein
MGEGCCTRLGLSLSLARSPERPVGAISGSYCPHALHAQSVDYVIALACSLLTRFTTPVPYRFLISGTSQCLPAVKHAPAAWEGRILLGRVEVVVGRGTLVTLFYSLLAHEIRPCSSRLLTLAVIAVGAIFAFVVPIAVTVPAIILPITIFHVTITVVRATSAITPVPVATVVIPITIAPIIIVVAAAAWWCPRAARRALTTAVAASLAASVTRWTARIESPTSRWWRASPLMRISVHAYRTSNNEHHTSILSTSSRPMRMLCISW